MDINNLTLGEVAKIEELSGQAISTLAEDDKPKGKLMAALAFVINRRTNPKYSLEDANKLTTEEFTKLLSSESEAVKN